MPSSPETVEDGSSRLFTFIFPQIFSPSFAFLSFLLRTERRVFYLPLISSAEINSTERQTNRERERFLFLRLDLAGAALLPWFPVRVETRGSVEQSAKHPFVGIR